MKALSGLLLSYLVLIFFTHFFTLNMAGENYLNEGEPLCGWQFAGRQHTLSEDRLHLDLRAYRLLSFDKQDFMRCLQAQDEGSPHPPGSQRLWLPLPTGNFECFWLKSSAVMDPALAAKFPEILTLAGQSQIHPSWQVRLEVNSRGVFAMLSMDSLTSYIQPLPNDSLHYITFYRHDILPGRRKPFEKRKPQQH